MILLLAVLPGYLAVTLWSRTKTWERPATDLKLVLLSLIFSAVIQVSLAWLTIPWLWPVKDHLADHPARVASWAFVVLILVPAVGGVLLGRVTDVLSGALEVDPPHWTDWKAWQKLLFPNPITKLFPPLPPSPWDKFFQDGLADGQFLIVTFEDGSMLAGSFYGPSFPGTSPQVQGIFLAEEWTVENGGIGQPVADSKGVLIPTIATIRHVKVMAGIPESQGKPK